MSAALELVDVEVAFGAQLVLEAVSLSIERGEYAAVIGPNGGGKSTLLRLITGLLAPRRGTVRVLGRSPDEARPWVGYVPQFRSFDRQFPMDVANAVAMGGLCGSRRKVAPEARVKEVLEQLQIADLAKRQVGALSGGQVQRVLIARALVSEPELLLLDEPTASLDPQSASGFYELLKGLADQRTVLLVSHEVGVVARDVSHIVCVNRRVYSHAGELTAEALEATYSCPVELLGHGLPHRVLGTHGRGGCC